MISKSNYFIEAKKIDYKSLPEALKEGFDTIKFGSKDYKTWEYLEDDKEFLAVYFRKLNKHLEKGKVSKPKPKSKAKVAGKTTSKTTKSAPKKTAKKPKPTKNDRIDLVERVPEEIRFIKRYTLLNEKVKTKHQVLLFINALQKAITEKRIRKTSAYAKEIVQIQDKLVKLYNEMGEEAKIEIGSGTLARYKRIADSEKIMPSITYIKRFISLHGKTGVKDKAKRLLDQMLKAVKAKKLKESDPYKVRLESVYRALREYIEGITKTPTITQAELNGLMGLVENNSLFAKKKSSDDNSLNGVSGVISSVQLSNMEFETIGLTGKYKDLIGDPSVGFSCMVYGKPKSGKSTLCIDFANHLAQHHGKVLYAAIEEGYGYTMKEKLERLGAVHPNLFVSENLPDKLSEFQFVFVDSVSKGKVDNEKLNELIQAHPKTAFIFIFHSTKEGDFRGGQENAHDVDCIIEVKDGVARGNGRFGVGGEVEVF
ncbi:P-loop NTPase family protein [Candidatus Venteria ishoeyi]|uniref:AAA+ ATPase domain-containing protein n=1 Tax=Candidatus Venteria ishoeyi TaxID=1899563 RepID=A0A1H6F4E9_9GAMM|nr:hypothetical protein [Candidatus Venteria ishoeyi]SEH05037.1 Uncharacterised protein [Candidatus Venteria ishoeyi]